MKFPDDRGEGEVLEVGEGKREGGGKIKNLRHGTAILNNNMDAFRNKNATLFYRIKAENH